MVGKQLAALVKRDWLGRFSGEKGKVVFYCYRGDSRYRDFWLGC